MKLYIWHGEGVLQDYTSGMVVALGSDLQEALSAVRAVCDHAMGLFPADKPNDVIEIGPAPCAPMARVCWGGG